MSGLQVIADDKHSPVPKWVRIRPGNPRGGEILRLEDFYEPERCALIVFEDVKVEVYGSQTITLAEPAFSAVVRKERGGRVIEQAICRPESVKGRKILFTSPTWRV